VEETGVNGSGGERRRAAARRPHGGDFIVFWDESQTTRARLLFICSKISEVIFKLELLLIVLELISSCSILKPLLMRYYQQRFETRTAADKMNTYQQ
jgi:hypothetical protein